MGAGRKPKFTAETKERIIKAIQIGGTYKLAAAAGRISEATLYKWLAEGRAGLPGKVEFLEDLKKAEAQNAQLALATIMKNIQTGHLTACFWMLERRHGYTKVNETSPASQAGVDDLDLTQLAQELKEIASASEAVEDEYLIEE